MARPDVDERSTTVVLRSLNNATRVFRNDVSLTMNRLDEEMQGNVDFSKIAPYASGVRTKKMWQETGDWNDSMWSCSQSVGLISDIPTCKDLLTGIVAEAEAQLTLSAACVAAPSRL
ncbi:unnamed protein product [Prorocentrum cordatum]|nr:unnamed protein product [Polarella glacialis]